MGYEVRSHDEMIFEAETFEEFQELLDGLAEQDRNGSMNHSDLNGTAYLQTHEPSWNRLEPTAEWSRITQALKERDELAAELESLKSRLPVNADGDVVLWGDEVWMWDAKSKKPVRGFVETIIEADEEHEFMGDMPDEKIPFTTPDWCCHSTAESCRAAHEKGE